MARKRNVGCIQIEIFKLISPGISDSNLENDPGIGHRKRSRYNHNESLATEAL
ncbi:1610_t:CDS:2, partial [Entrophospora sp. SA101]